MIHMKKWIHKKLQSTLDFFFPVPKQEEDWTPIPIKTSEIRVIEMSPEHIKEIESIVTKMLSEDAPLQVPKGTIDRGRGGLNHEVKDAVEVLVTRYRAYHQIPFDVTLSHVQIREVMSGIRKIVYQHEGRPMPKE